MAELTREQLIEEVKLKIAIAKCHPDSGVARVEGELFKIALVSLEAEAVGEFSEYKPGDWHQCSTGDKAPKWTSSCAVPPEQIAPEAIENAIEYIRSIAFYINEDDYNGKHIAHFMRQALAWLEGNSCRTASHGKASNPPVSDSRVSELTMLVKQLASQLKKAEPDCKLSDKAMGYLKRNGLISVGDVLR